MKDRHNLLDSEVVRKCNRAERIGRKFWDCALDLKGATVMGANNEYHEFCITFPNGDIFDVSVMPHEEEE